MKQRLIGRCGFGLLLLFLFGIAPPFALAQQGGGGAGAGSRRSTVTYPSSTGVGGAMITSDPETRKLIVVTDEETAKQIGQVVTNLDRPAPQVLIKVVFLEVTHRKGLDLGVEGSYHKNLGDGNTGIVNQIFGLLGQGALPNSPYSTIPGAGIYSIAGSDFTVVLRAIAESGKTEILSRPSILARNNQQAVITVGQQVPLITNVRYDTFGNQINGITYQDVGIILRVTPFITSEQTVEMIISPEISDLSEQSVAISSGPSGSVNAPVINVRSADTVVVTPDGQPVIIGGLMQNAKKEVISKIPLLGDIPWLGAAFRHTLRSDVKTELLIFLTPYIVKTPAQLAVLSATERSNMIIPNKAFSEHDLNRFLDTLPNNPEPTPPKKAHK